MENLILLILAAVVGTTFGVWQESAAAGVWMAVVFSVLLVLATALAQALS